MLVTDDAARARIRTPACRGSARRSAATASSPRSQTLWLNPGIARGVLELSRRDAGRRASTTRSDAEPGKILHETRSGEMARARRGAVRPLLRQRRRDAAVRDARRRVLTSAPATARSSRALWPHVERALDWIDRYGDRDGDGFVEYARRSATGLVQQGWKDSQDSVFHADGTLAERADRALRGAGLRLRRAAPAARRWPTRSATPTRADELRAQAERLRSAVRGRVLVRGARHLRARARRPQAAVPRADARTPGTVCSPASPRRSGRGGSRERLIGPEHVLGLGHPHDLAAPSRATTRCRTTTARCGRTTTRSSPRASSRYGFDDLIATPLDADCSTRARTMDGHRLPELFCGFHRRSGEGPTLYPVACSPQAWASGVVFQLHSGVPAAVDRRRRPSAVHRSRDPAAVSHAHSAAEHRAAVRAGRSLVRTAAARRRRHGAAQAGRLRGGGAEIGELSADSAHAAAHPTFPEQPTAPVAMQAEEHRAAPAETLAARHPPSDRRERDLREMPERVDGAFSQTIAAHCSRLRSYGRAHLVSVLRARCASSSTGSGFSGFSRFSGFSGEIVGWSDPNRV